MRQVHEQRLVEKLTLVVHMQGEPEHRLLSLKESEAKSLRTLKKKILNEFEYEQSQGRLMQVNIMQIYPSQPEHIAMPVLNEPNLKFLVDFLTSHERPIIINAVFPNGKQDLKRKDLISEQAIQMGVMYFDDNGSLIEQNDQMKELIPSDPKYDNSGYVRCEFCHKNSKNTDYLKKCGGLYGPFGPDNKYVHMLCAVWCHQIFLAPQDGMLKNVEEVISKSVKSKCVICKDLGAGLVCDGMRRNRKNRLVECNKRFHFRCASDSGCQMNWLSYKMLCPTCNQDDENEDRLLGDTRPQKIVIDQGQSEQEMVKQQQELSNKLKKQLFL